MLHDTQQRISTIFYFHGVGAFPHYHVVGISTRFHGVGFIMVLDTQQRISIIFFASTV